jgi:hypothetical protein
MQKPQFLTPENVQKCFSSAATNSSQFLNAVVMEFYNLASASSSVLPTLSSSFNNSARNLLDQVESIANPSFNSVISGKTELAKAIQRYINQCEFLNCSDELTTLEMKKEFALYYPGADQDICWNYVIDGQQYIEHIFGKMSVIKAPARSDFDYSIQVKDRITEFNHPLEGTYAAQLHIPKKDNERLMQALNLKAAESGFELANQLTLEKVGQEIITILKSIEFGDKILNSFKKVNVYQNEINSTDGFVVSNTSKERLFFNDECLAFTITFEKNSDTFSIFIENSPKEHWNKYISHEVRMKSVQNDNLTITHAENKGWIQYSMFLILEVKRIIEGLAEEVKSQ